MLAVSDAFNDAFKQDYRDIKMCIKINDVTYTDEDIISFNYNSGSIVGESFAIGSTFANTIKLTLCKILEGLKQLDEVVPEMGITTASGSIEWVKLGTFIISEQVNPDRNENKTSIECTDKMIMLDDPYESKLNYPAKIRDVALEIANLAGVEVDKVSFSRLMVNTVKKPEGYTFRQALGLVAQFEAGYAMFDRNGLLAIKTLEDKNYEVTPAEYFQKGLIKNELMFRPAGIKVRVSDGSDEEKSLSIGNDKGSVIVLENKVMTDGLLKIVYEKIKNINYYPYSLNWRGNPAVEVGDWLSVTDLKGNQFKVPNLSYSLEYKGGLTAQSTVETVASNEVRFGYKGILSQVIEYVNNSIKDIDGNMIYYGVEEPPNPKDGDTWFRYVDADTEIWVYEKIDEPDVFGWVFKISSAVDESIKNAIKDLEKDLEENQAKVNQALKDAENARKEAEEARQEAFESGTVAKQAEKDALEALALGDGNRTEIKKLDGQQKLTNTKVEGNTANIVSLRADSESLSLSIGKVQSDLNSTESDLATLEVSFKGFQTTVNSDISGVKSQQTQMAGQISSIVKDSEVVKDKLDKQSILTRALTGKILSEDPLFQTTSNGITTYNNATNGAVSVVRIDNFQGGTHPSIKESRFILKITTTGQANPIWGGFLKGIQGAQNSEFVVKFIAKIPTGRHLLLASNSLGTGGFLKWLTDNKGTDSWQEYAYYVKYGTGNVSSAGRVYAAGGSLPTSGAPLIWYISKYEDIEITSSNQTQIIQLKDQITLTSSKVETIDGTVTKQQGQITVLSNNINLKVDKNNVVAQINISPEKIKLDAKFIHLSGKSLIDSAVIKTAYIDNLAVTGAKIQDATIASAKIISIDANKINANSLSAITTNTGQLNVTGWLDFTTENRGLRGSYNFGDPFNASFNARWFDGNFRLSHRHLLYDGEIFKVNSNNSKGAKIGKAESYYGLDYVKLRSWDVSSNMSGRIDLTAQYLSMGTNLGEGSISNVLINSDGTGYFSNAVSFGAGISVGDVDGWGVTTARINAPTSVNRLLINNQRNLGGLDLGNDGKTYIRSGTIYARTYNSQPQVCITSEGTLGRIVSAKKYKDNIMIANDLIDKSKLMLTIMPKSWTAKDGDMTRYYGFIADDFDDLGLREVVLYNGLKEVEGLSYDRITTYHNVILSEHEKKIIELESQIEMLEGKVNALSA